MKKSEILRAIKANLQEHRGSHFICIQLEAMGEEQTKSLREWIVRLLTINGNHYITLSGWLRVNGVHDKSLTAERMRFIRCRWIDWMIEQLEAQGD